ncbi:MAG: histidine kinase [Gammaproteobacteria bacterium]|nr:histidine kinase [Gammaproteobacteria bacterium]
MIITLAFVIFRTSYLRDHLLHGNRYGSGWLILAGLFSALAIYGTHAGMVVSMDGEMTPVPWSYELREGEAVVNFRDLVVVTSGLAGGPWLGASVGAIAGFERYRLGGFTGLSCGLASLLGGLLAGLFRRKLDARITPKSAAGIAAFAVIVQMALILFLAKPFGQAIILVKQIGVPMLLTVTAGCYVFQQVIQVLDRDRLELLARRAEIRALHAQTEPHFLINTLSNIIALIRTDADKARHYLTELGQFLQETKAYAKIDTITVEEELQHLHKYLDFQRLRFDDSINYHETIEDPALLKNQIPPRTLHTLVENALAHGSHSSEKPCTITVMLRKREKFLELSVEDTGVGISPERLARIGNEPVSSNHEGGGHALYQLQQTLKLMWGDDAQLVISSQVTQGTTVTLILPLTQAG